ncbi:hypothetical protein ACFYNO_35315 [Kitasatospora sp. NPDC006697]|uniref:hypothetical protein n=1 Tax=Kitasatospora sp. NPDC006697 TaxID=3364020 RepID=UPI00367A5D9B
MPDRAGADRRRAKRGAAAKNPAGQNLGHLPCPADWPDGPSERASTPHPLGIPRIIGRRARWVGARLRREA